MSLYRPILTDAWRLAVRAPRLTAAGFLTALVIGSGFGSALTQTFGADPLARVVRALAHPSRDPLRAIGAVIAQAIGNGPIATVGLAVYGLVIAALVAALIAFAIASANAIVLGADATGRGVALPARIRRAAFRPFARALSVHAMTAVAAGAVLWAWGAVLNWAAVGSVAAATVWAVIAFVIATILLAVLHAATPVAIVGVVLDGRSPSAALREALVLLRDRWLIAVEASFLLTLVQIASVAAWVIGSVLLGLPFAFLAGIGVARGDAWVVNAAVAVGIPVLTAYLLVIVALTATVTTASWTLLTLRLTSPGAEPEPWIRRLGRR